VLPGWAPASIQWWPHQHPWFHSSTSMVQSTEDYAAHFYYMYINKHVGKHLTGDQIQMLCYMTCYKTYVTYYITCYITCIHNKLHNMLHNVLHNLLKNMFWVRSPTSMPGFMQLKRVSLYMEYHTWKIQVISLFKSTWLLVANGVI